MSSRCHNNLVWHGPVDVHAVDRPACLEGMRLHALHFGNDHGVLACPGARHEPPAGSDYLPIGQRVNPERPEDLELDQ